MEKENPYGIIFAYPILSKKCIYCEKEFPQNEHGFFTNEKNEEFHFDCYIRDVVKEQVKIELEKIDKK